jgi:FtsZ-binding cell division protein ZapB
MVGLVPGHQGTKPPRLSATSLSRPAVTKSNFAAPRPATAPAAQLDRRSIEQQLIENLRQQVTVLEVENAHLKERLVQAGSPTAGATSYAAPPGALRSATTTTVKTTTVQAGALSGAAVPGAAARMNLLQRVEELQAEVDALRHQYARREQEHAVELSELRTQLIQGGVVDGLVGGHRFRGTEREEVAVIREQHQRDVEQARQRFAADHVHLEKTIERLRAEGKSHDAEMELLVKEKEDLTRELITVKDSARTSLTNLDIVQRQYHEAMSHLASEQDRRRDLENREKDLKERLAEATQSATAATRTTELESRLKEATTALNTTKFELEKTRVMEARLSAEVQTLIKEKSERDCTDATKLTNNNEFTAKHATLQQKYADVESEREYFRLSTDRLKVENSVLTVKITQLEAKNNSDRASVLTLERQYTTAIETIEALRRELKGKENVYNTLDQHDAELRHQHRLAVDEAEHLRRQNAALREGLAEVTAKYDAIKEFGDAVKAEQQLSAALAKLDKTKAEMHNMLQTQVKLSQDVSAVIGDIPEASLQATHHRSMLSLGNTPARSHHHAHHTDPSVHAADAGTSVVHSSSALELLAAAQHERDAAAA